MIGLSGLMSKRRRGGEPITWTSRSTAINFWTTGDYVSCAGYDGTYYVIGCGGEARIATATDPTSTWTENASNPFGGNDLRVLAYNGTYWCVVGYSPDCNTATDPTGTWTDQDDIFASGNIYAMDYDGTYICVASSDGDLKYVVDPTGEWSTPTTGSIGSHQINFLAYGNGYWLSGNNYWLQLTNSNIYTATTNPTGVWTVRTHPFADYTNIRDAAYGNGYWVMVANQGQLATATDPTGTWTLRTSSFDAGDQINKVAYGNGAWACTGTGGKIATATDPTGTWTQRTNPETTHGWCMKYLNGYWIWGGEDAKLCTAVNGF